MGLQNLTSNPLVVTIMVVAVLLILAGLGFMASQSAAITSAAGTVTSLLGLIALIWAVRQVQGGKR